MKTISKLPKAIRLGISDQLRVSDSARCRRSHISCFPASVRFPRSPAFPMTGLSMSPMFALWAGMSAISAIASLPPHPNFLPWCPKEDCTFGHVPRPPKTRTAHQPIKPMRRRIINSLFNLTQALLNVKNVPITQDVGGRRTPPRRHIPNPQRSGAVRGLHRCR